MRLPKHCLHSFRHLPLTRNSGWVAAAIAQLLPYQQQYLGCAPVSQKPFQHPLVHECPGALQMQSLFAHVRRVVLCQTCQSKPARYTTNSLHGLYSVKTYRVVGDWQAQATNASGDHTTLSVNLHQTSKKQDGAFLSVVTLARACDEHDELLQPMPQLIEVEERNETR